MQQIPQNALERKDRAFACLIADICDISVGKSKNFERTDALRSVALDPAGRSTNRASSTSRPSGDHQGERGEMV